MKRLPGARSRVLAGLALGLWAVAVAIAGGSTAVAAQAPEGSPSVLVTRIDDPITAVISDHLSEAVDEAEEDGYAALVVELDTPGGLDTAMRDIVQSFLAAEVPVVVYVSPSGGRAASAGALIAWSAHFVAMAPGTTIGAATPVSLEGGEVGDKIVNDAAAYARAVAEERGRNVEVAADAVTEGRALSATEAVEEGVADLVVEDRAALLAAVDGTSVVLASGETVTLRTAGAAVVERDLSFLRSLLQFLADPNLAFLFLSLGTLAIVYEFATPGIGVGGGAGAVLILLSLVALSVLPIDAAGLVFLALAAVLFGVEVFAPGIGVAAALGSVSLVLAGVFLFRNDTPGLSVSLAAVLPTAAVVGFGVVFAGRLALRAREEPSPVGPLALVGSELTVAHASDAGAQARAGGAWWNVRSAESIEAGDRVVVDDVDGLDLLVRRVDPNDKETTS